MTSSSSIYILARRLMSVTAAPRLRLLTNNANTPHRYSMAAFSTNAKNTNTSSSNTTTTTTTTEMNLNDTHMHDEFQILERILEQGNLHSADEDKVAELRALLKSAPMAVDAPDGTSDSFLKEELREIQFILDDVVAHKDQINAKLDKIKVRMAEAQRIYAVDSPDGEVDAHLQEEQTEIDRIVTISAAVHEDAIKINEQHHPAAGGTHQGAFYAVDSPDGEADGHFQEDQREVNQIISEAAAKEDTLKINRQHKTDVAVRKEQARDPEHDW